MKANELMIGDWVRIELTQVNTRVYGIDSVASLVTAHHALVLRPQKIEPIPLTAEILEKNGFELAAPYGKYEWSDGHTEIWVVMGDLNGLGESRNVVHIDDWQGRIPVCYHNTIACVHELQHALRLCKIDKEIIL